MFDAHLTHATPSRLFPAQHTPQTGKLARCYCLAVCREQQQGPHVPTDTAPLAKNRAWLVPVSDVSHVHVLAIAFAVSARGAEGQSRVQPGLS